MATINDTRLPGEILTGSPTVAVLGIHREPEKAAYYVPEYLHDEGYRVDPASIRLFPRGDVVRQRKSSFDARGEIPEPIDIVDAPFRRPEQIPAHAIGHSRDDSKTACRVVPTRDQKLSDAAKVLEESWHSRGCRIALYARRPPTARLGRSDRSTLTRAPIYGCVHWTRP